jgi:hypothetical protein
MANKITDFQLILPDRAERIQYNQLNSDEQTALLGNDDLSDHAIYKYSVGIKHGLEDTQKVKNKYKWQKVFGISFGTELRTKGYQFVGGIYPIKLSSNESSNRDRDQLLEYSVEVGIDKFVTAKVAGKILRNPNDRYAGIKLASRSDRFACWTIERKWFEEHNLSCFEVVCVIPSQLMGGKSYCKICAVRKNGENIQTKSKEVILAYA